MDRSSLPQVPLHLTSLAILSPSNAPLYVRSFTGAEDELRHYHLAHAAVDVIEERIIMNSTPTKPADAYLGLLFCMEDMAFYGFQSASKLRMVVSVALVDALIKDSDVVAIFRAVYHLLLTAVHNPFLSLSPTFTARRAGPSPEGPGGDEAGDALAHGAAALDLKDTASAKRSGAGAAAGTTGEMFAVAPDEIQPGWLGQSRRFEKGIERIGEILGGGR